MHLAGDPPTDRAPGLAEVRVERAGGGTERDWVVVEEPLQIRVDGENLAVTLRTPGADRELAAGFVFTEGLVDAPEDLASVERARDVIESSHPENTVNVRLTAAAARELPRRREHAARAFRAVAACGVCGKKTIDSLRQTIPPIAPLAVPRELVESLPGRMRAEQRLFADTGGIHAAALFEPDGRLVSLFEDIGRHNAVDKLVGHALLNGPWPLAGRIILTSGRAGFEVVQKALRAAVPVLAAVGAASSLSVEMAREAGMTLYSFVGPGRGNRHV
jgi:FdhD protein